MPHHPRLAYLLLTGITLALSACEQDLIWTSRSTNPNAERCMWNDFQTGLFKLPTP